MIVSTDHLSKWYGQVSGLNDVTISIPPGVTGLLGPNGAGKSTLMKLVTGQLRPSAGTIRVFDAPIWGNPSQYRRLGFCPEQDAFYEHMTGRDWVAALAGLHGMDDAAAAAAATTALDTVDLLDVADRKIGGYSKGMRQRVKLAQAIVHDPELLVLDEPLNGLDPLVRAETIALFRAWASEGKHVILSSHVLQEVDLISDQVVLIANGMIIAEGTIRTVRDEIQEHPSQYLVRCGDPSGVASILFSEDHVTEIRLNDDRMGLLVMTRDREQFARVLGRIALDGHRIETVVPADENVDALYEYLIGGE